ncbi:Ribosomal RNA small subunit methyltransferase D [Lachnospiraceae bacterium TWA4]|nr:Ribosomal RNA small subunit methyltransferase D [Lachnospiraceae bacterium TWA4]
MDPPYNKKFELKVLELLNHSPLVHKDTLFIVEASLDTDTSYLEDLGYYLEKEKLYKTNKHLFIKLKETTTHD